MIGYMMYFTPSTQPRSERRTYRSVPEDFVRLEMTRHPRKSVK